MHPLQYHIQIGKECTTCTREDKTVKETDILLATADLGAILHYDCVLQKRKEFCELIFKIQDDRHAEYLAKDAGNSAEKKAKLEQAESAVSFSALAAFVDSDDDL